MTPYLTFKDPRAAIARYEAGLGATCTLVMDGPEDSVMHAELTLSGATLMLSGEWPGFASAPVGRSPVNFMHHVDDLASAIERARGAGFILVAEPKTEFWGDRIARLDDGHGYEWTLAQTVEDVSPDELERRAAAYATQMAAGD